MRCSFSRLDQAGRSGLTLQEILRLVGAPFTPWKVDASVDVPRRTLWNSVLTTVIFTAARNGPRSAV